ncbi:MAG TPA: biotin--[acetyl-CoA-carboxylase] ligase [Acidobacteriaceae bacterium]|nr:biotin--[acetyl-CoA-carboxylase] ligase [Acidobacteriaceae bacterium]
MKSMDIEQESNTIHASAVGRAIELLAISGPVTWLPVTGSTNQLALEAAQAGARRGIWVTDEQTAGRGRGGHSWHSTRADGLYLSVLVTPELPLDRALWLSLATGLAAQQAILSTTGIRIDLRWPNDLLCDGRKLGGILVETSVANAATGASAALRYAVIGVGINVYHESFPPEIASLATSLRLEGAAVLSRQTLLIALLRALDRELDELDREYAGVTTDESILSRFTRASSWVQGKRVQVPEDGGYTGVTSGLDSRGFLVVDDDQRVRRTVLSGGVREV